MKCLYIMVLGMICFQTIVLAQEVKVEIRGIRSAKGNIMVMAQPDANTKPVYAMVKASKDTVSVVLKDVPWKEFQLSLYHDENGNWEMDKNAQGMPIEGYAREKCKKEQDASTAIKVKLYYPVQE